MKTNMGFLEQNSFISGSFQGNSDESDDDQSIRISRAENTENLSTVAAGLVVAVTIVGIGVSNALAAFEPFAVQSIASTEPHPEYSQTISIETGTPIQLAALGDPNSIDAPEDSNRPADRDFEFARAAAADAQATAAPLRAPSTDRHAPLTMMAPADSGDMTIGMRLTAPVHLTFSNLPEAPDPMPGLNARQSAWAGFSIAMIIILLTLFALAPLRGQSARPRTEDC